MKKKRCLMKMKCIFKLAKLLKLTFFLPFFALFPIISGGGDRKKQSQPGVPIFELRIFFQSVGIWQHFKEQEAASFIGKC